MPHNVSKPCLDFLLGVMLVLSLADGKEPRFAAGV